MIVNLSFVRSIETAFVYMSVDYVLIFLSFFLFYHLLFTLHFYQKLRLSAVSLKNKMNKWMNESALIEADAYTGHVGDT